MNRSIILTQRPISHLIIREPLVVSDATATSRFRGGALQLAAWLAWGESFDIDFRAADGGGPESSRIDEGASRLRYRVSESFGIGIGFKLLRTEIAGIAGSPLRTADAAMLETTASDGMGSLDWIL